MKAELRAANGEVTVVDLSPGPPPCVLTNYRWPHDGRGHTYRCQHYRPVEQVIVYTEEVAGDV